MSYLKYFSFLITGVFIGWLFWDIILPKFSPTTYDNPPLRVKDSQYKFISPLFACGNLGKEEFQEFQPLETKLQKLINKNISAGDANVVSIYFRDLDKGRRLSINENESYFPASLQKVPLMIAYYKLSDIQPDILSKIIYYSGEFDDNAKEDIKSEKVIKAGRSYSIDDLIAAMIINSDNNATRLLFDNINKNILSDVYSDIGLTLPKVGENLDYMTVKNFSYFFRILYNATYLSKSLSDKALTLLSNTDFTNGIRADIPKEIPVSEKFGESTIYFENGKIKSKELHDCGIVYHPQSSYLLCIMTKGNDFDKLAKVIQDVSQSAYKELTIK